jgi:hypothetical protein
VGFEDVGNLLGLAVGFEDVGDLLGLAVGFEDVGDLLGLAVGFADVGALVGRLVVGAALGLSVGPAVGFLASLLAVGLLVETAVGEPVAIALRRHLPCTWLQTVTRPLLFTYWQQSESWIHACRQLHMYWFSHSGLQSLLRQEWGQVELLR